jgi:hypothetical protein
VLPRAGLVHVGRGACVAIAIVIVHGCSDLAASIALAIVARESSVRSVRHVISVTGTAAAVLR